MILLFQQQGKAFGVLDISCQITGLVQQVFFGLQTIQQQPQALRIPQGQLPQQGLLFLSPQIGPILPLALLAQLGRPTQTGVCQPQSGVRIVLLPEIFVPQTVVGLHGQLLVPELIVVGISAAADVVV